MNFETTARYEQRKAALEQKEAIEQMAASAVAQTDMIHGANISVYNSYDKTVNGTVDEDVPSFMRANDNSRNTLAKWKKERTGALDSDDSFRAPGKDNVSELDATQATVKHNNLVSIFLKGTEVDQYIINNLYGRGRYQNHDDPSMSMGEMTMLDGMNTDETFTHQIQAMHRKSLISKRGMEPEDQKIQGLSAFQTYVALIKGYCALLVLVLPRSFTHGGYLFSPFCILVSGLVQFIAASKLVEVGSSVGLKSYSLITLKVLGPKAKVVLDIMIALTQYSFTITFCAFMTETWVTILQNVFDVSVGPWTPGIVLLVILTLMAWIRDISKFSSTMLIGNLCILATLIIVTIMMIYRLTQRGFTPGPDVIPMNFKEFWAMVGFSCYTFEGIGVVMPIMHACSVPEQFPTILLYAMGTLIVIYSFFGDLVYYTLGSGLKHSFVTQEIDQKSVIVIILNILYCTNTMCSYAICIFPANQIVEDYTLRNLTRKIKNMKGPDAIKLRKLKYSLQNLSRFLVALSAMYFAIQLSEVLDQFLSVLGALLCAPLAILFPALLHLVALAKTKEQKMKDISLIILAVTVMVFSTVQTISSW